MELILKSVGSTSKFVNWLKGFKDIYHSLLLEIDLDEQAFITKCFPTSKAVVKYSKITFEEAGYEFVKILDNAGVDFDWKDHNPETSGRINLGIYQILSKFTDVINLYSETEHDLDIKFDICKNIKYINLQKTVTEYQGEAIILKSLSLKMVNRCTKISEFFERCDDDTFINKVCKIDSPSTFEVSADTIANLIKISSFYSIDKAKDIVKLISRESDGRIALYAYDESNGSYEYLLGYYVEGESAPVDIIMFKENFLNAIKGMSGDIMKFTIDTNAATRVLIENSDSKVIVSKAIKPEL